MTTAGQRHALARYELPCGQRVLYGQRIGGCVAVSDVPVDHAGRVYLVERHIESQASLNGLLADYLSETHRRGEPAALVSDDLVAP